MKKVIIWLLVSVLLFGFSGCGRIAEKGIEKIIENQTGVDIDDNTFTIEGEDGSTVEYTSDGENSKITTDEGTFEAGTDLKWPTEYMGDIPELSGKITVVYSGEDGATVGFQSIDKNTAQEYAQKLLDLGYTGMNMVDEDGIFISGTNDKGAIVIFTFNIDSKEATIAYTPPQED